MKLATYRDDSRDGHLVVVSRDLSTAHYATGIATRLQQVLDDWNFLSPQLQDLYETLNHGKARHAFAFDPHQCLAPLPRAGQWALGVRDAEAEGGLRMVRVAGNDLAPAQAAVGCATEAEALPGLEVRVAALMGDVPRGASGSEALDGVRLLVLAVTAAMGNDALALRPFTACSAVAVTPDELAPSWGRGKVDRPMARKLNGRAVAGLVEADGRVASLGQALKLLAAHRAVRAGSLVAAAPWVGEPLDGISLGDSVTHELLGIDGLSVFGAMEQSLTPRA